MAITTERPESRSLKKRVPSAGCRTHARIDFPSWMVSDELTRPSDTRYRGEDCTRRAARASALEACARHFHDWGTCLPGMCYREVNLPDVKSQIGRASC